MKQLIDIIVKAIHEKKGERVIAYDFLEVNPYVETMIICSASSLRQVMAIATNIKERVRENGYDIRSIEGNGQSSWVLVDAHEVVVQIFDQEERGHFQLEKLYADLPRKELSI